MNFTTTVMMILVFFLLCSGIFQFTFASNLRIFNHPSEDKNWNEARRECNEKNGSLVTLYDDEDATFMRKYVTKSSSGFVSSVWLGLTKTRTNVTTWSNGAPFIFSRSSVNLPDREQICEAMDKNTWKGFTCSGKHYFMCYKGDTRIRVINRTATWEEALDYCEENYISLLWIKDVNDQEAVKQWLEVSGYTGTFWIGLRQSIMFGFWIWKDSPVLESNWKDDKAPEMPFSNQCGVINATDNKWSDENCFNKHPFICAEKILKY
uniref:C-type lectin domain-containing protein n=1 Tax=Amphiprion ocellaris TaxID=80972 RepID=A0A3Q1CHF3_AMPOC